MNVKYISFKLIQVAVIIIEYLTLVYNICCILHNDTKIYNTEVNYLGP